MTALSLKEKIAVSGAAIRRTLGSETLPETLVVLGSGFKGFETTLRHAKSLDLAEIPYFPIPKVAGHGCALVIGESGQQKVGVLTGRVHLYEGHDAQAVVYPIRVMAALGVKRVMLTNAAGSVDPNVRPGQVVLVSDHINLTGRNCLVGEGSELGPIFLDMGECYDPRWRASLKQCGDVVEGVYAGLLGPTYETPAETRMLGRLGVQVVGMSTVQETIAAHQLRLRVACLSFVTNMAGGLGSNLSHAEVLELAAKHKPQLQALLTKAVNV